MPAKLSLSPAQDDAATRAATPGPCPAGFGSWSSARGSSAGLTMVELLVAMGAGLFLVGGILQVMVSSKASYRLGEAEARVQENGRFAVQVLAADLRGTHGAGCRSDTLNVVACDLLDLTDGQVGCVGESAVGWDRPLDRPLGYAGSQKGTADWLTKLPGNNTVGAQAKVVSQWLRGDVLVSWGVRGAGIYMKAPGSLGDDLKGSVDLIAPGDAGHEEYCDLHQGRLALVTDCETSDVFAISNPAVDDCRAKLSEAKVAEITPLRHAETCESGCPDRRSGKAANSYGALSGRYNLNGAGATPRARVFPFDYSVYYVCCMNSVTGKIQPYPGEPGTKVANCVEKPGQYRPALCRWSTRTNGAEQLVSDVADLRVIFDGYVDSRSGERFLDVADAAPDAAWVSGRGYWDRVDSVRIQLLATTAEEIRTQASVPNPNAAQGTDLGYGLASDRRIYHAYDVTTAIRSRSAWYLRP